MVYRNVASPLCLTCGLWQDLNRSVQRGEIAAMAALDRKAVEKKGATPKPRAPGTPAKDWLAELGWGAATRA